MEKKGDNVDATLSKTLRRILRRRNNHERVLVWLYNIDH